MAYEGKIPFTTKAFGKPGDRWYSPAGCLMGYPEEWQGIEWRQNFTFCEALTFDRFERGRSAAHAIFKAGDGREFQMFLTDLETALKDLAVFRGKIEGVTWTFTKRGKNYGICMAE